MNKDFQLIMAVRRSTLFEVSEFQGFKSVNDSEDYEGIILKNYNWLRRAPAEKDSNFKQPIGYALVMHEPTKEIFAYRRAGSADESRLQQNWSWGVGGHIELHDTNEKNPIESSMKREVQEEIGLDQFNSIEVIGYINDETNDVGQVHFGILYLVKSDIKVTVPIGGDDQTAEGDYYTLDQLTQMTKDDNIEVENWSKISLEALND